MNDPKSFVALPGWRGFGERRAAVVQLGASASAGSDDAGWARVFAHDMLCGPVHYPGDCVCAGGGFYRDWPGGAGVDQAGELRSLMRAGAPLQLLTTARRLETIIPAMFAASGAAVVGLAFTAPVLGGGMFQSQGALLMLGSLVGGDLVMILASEACGPITKQVLREQTRQE